MTDLIDYYRRGWLCIGYNDECRDRSSGCPCTETAEALEAQQAVIAELKAALQKIVSLDELYNEAQMAVIAEKALAKLRKSDE